MLNVLFISEILCFVILLFSRNQIIVIPLFIVGLLSNSYEIFKMLKKRNINKIQLGRCVVLLFFEFLFFIDYFIQFIPFNFWN